MRHALLTLLASAAFAQSADPLDAATVRAIALAQREYLTAKAALDAATQRAQKAHADGQAACAKVGQEFDANAISCVEKKAAPTKDEEKR